MNYSKICNKIVCIFYRKIVNICSFCFFLYRNYSTRIVILHITAQFFWHRNNSSWSNSSRYKHTFVALFLVRLRVVKQGGIPSVFIMRQNLKVVFTIIISITINMVCVVIIFNTVNRTSNHPVFHAVGSVVFCC